MTEREALKLALEALTRAMSEPTDLLHTLGKAADAIREALAQPEPVIDKPAAIRIATAFGWEPKRTWVGLTDEEIAEIMVQIWSNNNISVRERNHRLARAIEVKLKDKNT